MEISAANFTVVNLLRPGEHPEKWKEVGHDNAGITITEVANSNGYESQFLKDAESYQGYSHDGQGNSLNINLLNKDLNSYQSNNIIDISYQEVSKVSGVKDADQSAALHEAMDQNKLTDLSNMDLAKEGAKNADIRLQYGVSEFHPQLMYGNNTDEHGSAPKLLENNLSAQAEFTTKNGNHISVSFEMKEQLDLGGWGTYAKSPFETFEEYDARVEKAFAQGPVSTSDYRSVAIKFSSGEALSEEDAKHLNQISDFLMSVANASASSELTRENSELKEYFQVLSEKVDGLKITGQYEGYAQGDTSFSMKLVNDAVESSIRSEDINQNGLTKRFWS